MTDIVDRLRSGNNPTALWLEAADEIERLRAALREIASASTCGGYTIGYESGRESLVEIAKAALGLTH